MNTTEATQAVRLLARWGGQAFATWRMAKMFTVRVKGDGAVTIPKVYRDRYGLGVGTELSVIDVDGVLVLTRTASTVATLTGEIDRHRAEAGLTDEDLVAALRTERERISQERGTATEAV